MARVSRLSILLALAAAGCGGESAARAEPASGATRVAASADGSASGDTAPSDAPAAADTGVAVGEVRAYRGHFVFDWERQGFQRCGAPDRWWIVNPDSLDARLRAAGVETGRDSGRWYVEVRGAAGPPGTYGHQDEFTRELTLHSVDAARPDSPPDCP